MYHFSSRNLSREATKAIKHINPQVHRERHGSDITPQQKRKPVWKRSSPILQAPSPPSLFFFLSPSCIIQFCLQILVIHQTLFQVPFSPSSFSCFLQLPVNLTVLYMSFMHLAGLAKVPELLKCFCH